MKAPFVHRFRHFWYFQQQLNDRSHINSTDVHTVLSVPVPQMRLPFSIFLNVSWSNVKVASFRYLAMDSTSGGILPPRKLDSLVWCADMVQRYGTQRDTKTKHKQHRTLIIISWCLHFRGWDHVLLGARLRALLFTSPLPGLRSRAPLHRRLAPRWWRRRHQWVCHKCKERTFCKWRSGERRANERERWVCGRAPRTSRLLLRRLISDKRGWM